jgi:hypothetical protein
VVVVVVRRLSGVAVVSQTSLAEPIVTQSFRVEISHDICRLRSCVEPDGRYVMLRSYNSEEFVVEVHDIRKRWGGTAFKVEEVCADWLYESGVGIFHREQLSHQIQAAELRGHHNKSSIASEVDKKIQDASNLLFGLSFLSNAKSP